MDTNALVNKSNEMVCKIQQEMMRNLFENGILPEMLREHVEKTLGLQPFLREEPALVPVGTIAKNGDDSRSY